MRPLHPLLPEEWVSKALRVAMSESDWERFSALVRRYTPMAPTQARAYGLALADLLDSAAVAHREPGPLDWMDWEHRKTIRLLMSRSSPERWQAGH